jgi:hypothetical protein
VKIHILFSHAAVFRGTEIGFRFYVDLQMQQLTLLTPLFVSHPYDCLMHMVEAQVRDAGKEVLNDVYITEVLLPAIGFSARNSPHGQGSFYL